MNLYIPTPLPEAEAASQELQHRLQQEIRQSEAIPFSRFMERALYEPKLGYYTGGSQKIGHSGDFITAPALSPLFGKTLATQLNTLLPQTAGNLYEFGAGTGELAAVLLNSVAGHLNHYYIIEVSSELAQRQRETIRQIAPHMAERVIYLPELPEQFDGIIIGNEVLDAMPVELVRQKNGQFQRIFVSEQNQQFVQTARLLTDFNLLQKARQYFPETEEPYTSELHPAQYAFIRTLAARLARGAIIMIDYGFDAAQYYHPQRSMGTLIGHHRHHTVHDPFYRIGLTDLTAHVNFTDIAQAGIDGGLDLIGYATQAHFLLNLGITEQLAATAPSDTADYLKAASAVQTLINQHEMGELFKVIAFGHDIDTDWQGFQFGDICYKL